MKIRKLFPLQLDRREQVGGGNYTNRALYKYAVGSFDQSMCFVGAIEVDRCL